MSKRSGPEIHKITTDQCSSLAHRIDDWSIPANDKKIVKAALETLLFLFKILEQKNATIRQLHQFFQFKSEKKKKILPGTQADQADQPEQTDESQSEKSQSALSTSSGSKGKKKRKGVNGRLAAREYKGANIEFYPHETYSAGDRCPDCKGGCLHDITGPGFLRIVGNPPLSATCHCQQKFRCSCCGKRFKAPLPPDVEKFQKEKYAPTAKSMIALLKYGTGFPLYRLSQLQHSLGVPLAPATQWDLMFALFRKVYPVSLALYQYAAQGAVLYHDDTHVRILKMPPPKETGHDPQRTGLNTTAIIAQVDDREIAIFCSGRNHAGENLEHLLLLREEGKDPPIQACDAAIKNIRKNIASILAFCLVHGRRNFVNILDVFPAHASHVIEELAKVFHHDNVARENNYDPQQRLVYHQQHSKPVMDKLRKWLENLFVKKEVEPNSSLGKACNYMLNHFSELTTFLRVPGAPLDTNCVERALKKAILLRKNAYFYKTEKGALVGDLLMTLIETCRLNKINPFDYLTSLQVHSEKVRKSPEKWFPWNFERQITTAEQAA